MFVTRLTGCRYKSPAGPFLSVSITEGKMNIRAQRVFNGTRSARSHQKTTAFGGGLADQDCWLAGHSWTLQVLMRPALVSMRPSATAPTESGKRFQNLGEATGTIPFSRHQPA